MKSLILFSTLIGLWTSPAIAGTTTNDPSCQLSRSSYTVVITTGQGALTQDSNFILRKLRELSMADKNIRYCSTERGAIELWIQNLDKYYAITLAKELQKNMDRRIEVLIIPKGY